MSTAVSIGAPHADAPPRVAGAVDVSVVLPCLNEAETLETCIRKASGSLASLGVTGEIVVADNGSTDGSQQIARRLGARVIDVPVRGYGSALRAGIAAAHGTYVIMGDADDSYDLARLDAFLESLRDGADLVVGNRFEGGIEPGAMPALHRYFGNPVLSRVGRLLFRVPVRDFHCGLRGFRREAISALGLRTSGMEYASEMLVKARMHGLRIAEVPTTLRPDGRSRPPHLRSWRDGWRHLRFLLLYSPRWLYLYPGAALMLIGLATMAWLLPGPRYVGRFGLDIQTLLYAGGAVAVGYQTVLFGLMAKVFAITEGLLPPSARLDRVFRHVRLETGLLGGVAMIALGILGAVLGFRNWAANGYGHLDPSHTLRLAIPSLLALMLGVETIVASFFFSLLGVRRLTGPGGSADGTGG